MAFGWHSTAFQVLNIHDPVGSGGLLGEGTSFVSKSLLWVITRLYQQSLLELPEWEVKVDTVSQRLRMAIKIPGEWWEPCYMTSLWEFDQPKEHMPDFCP